MSLPVFFLSLRSNKCSPIAYRLPDRRVRRAITEEANYAQRPKSVWAVSSDARPRRATRPPESPRFSCLPELEACDLGQESHMAGWVAGGGFKHPGSINSCSHTKSPNVGLTQMFIMKLLTVSAQIAQKISWVLRFFYLGIKLLKRKEKQMRKNHMKNLGV